MTNFVDWIVEKGQQDKSLLSSEFLWRDICSFLNENYLKLTTKRRKNFSLRDEYNL